MMRTLVTLIGLVVLLVGASAWQTAAQTKPEPSGPTYVGAAACLCHADPIQKSWQVSKHAKAFELLKLVGQEKNEKCLPCHTTGYGRGGYGSPDMKANLEGVQCEECHGPASAHATTLDKTKVTRTPSAVVCARCHQDLNIHAKP